MIRVENIHHMVEAGDTKRFLIDREWPASVVRSIPRNEESGHTRRALAQIQWLPELAPSAALWKWFHHDADKIELFRSRYFREVGRKKTRWAPIAQAAQKEEIVLLYHGKRTNQTPAHFFKEFLDIQSRSHRIPSPPRKKHVELPFQGVAVPVEKAISRKHSQPLKEEMQFKPKQKLTFVPAGRRRVL